MDIPLTGEFSTAGHRPYFTPDAPSHFKIKTRTSARNNGALTRIPLPPTFPTGPNDAPATHLTVSARWGVFSFPPHDFLLILGSWEGPLSPDDTLRIIDTTEAGTPFTFSLNTYPIDLRFTYRNREGGHSLTTISTLFTARHKRGLAPNVAASFTDRLTPVTHRVLTPHLFQIWTRM